MRAAGACLLTLVLALMSGCAPGTPNAESWRFDAIKAVGDVSSSVATVQLALDHDHDIFAPYVKAASVEAEDAAGKAAQKISALQPPAGYRTPYDTVTSTLDDADSLLAAARIAVVQHDRAAYPKLRQQLSKMADRLTKLEGRIRNIARKGHWS